MKYVVTSLEHTSTCEYTEHINILRLAEHVNSQCFFNMVTENVIQMALHVLHNIFVIENELINKVIS